MNSKLLLMVLMALGLIMWGCEEDDGGNDGEVTAVYASLDLVEQGGTVEFDAEVDGDGDVEYSASAGNFADAIWTAPSADGTVTITASLGDTEVTTTVVVANVPAATSQWSFNEDGRDGIGSEDLTYGGTTDIDPAGMVGGAILFAGENLEDGEASDLSGVAFGPDLSSLSMEAADAYTFSLWINTAESVGLLFGKTYAGAYTPYPDGTFGDGSAKCIFMGDWFGETEDSTGLVFDNSWVNGFEHIGTLADENWHHVAVTKTDTDYYTIYLDGVASALDEVFGTTPDIEQVITIGGGQEAAAYGPWPGMFAGMMDEIVFWQSALTEAQINAIYDAH